MVYYRLDLIFSYWILIWFLIYMIGFIKTPPILLMYLGVVGNMIEILYLSFNKASRYNLIKFFTINVFLKMIPLLFIFTEKITTYEIKLTFIIFFIYLLWVYLNKENVITIYSKHLLTNYATGKGEKTIVSVYYDKLYNTIFKK